MGSTDLTWVREDSVASEIFRYIKKMGPEGAHLNELARELTNGSRVTILNRLNRMETLGILKSDMERSISGEERVQKWMRKYRFTPKYLGASL